MSASFSPGPWAWRKLGGQWHLVQDIGPRQVILTAGVVEQADVTDLSGEAELLTRDPATGTLVPIEPTQGNARLLAAAPDLLAALLDAGLAMRATVEHYGWPLPVTMARIEAAIGKAFGRS